MKKMVNGVDVELSPQEEAELLAERAAISRAPKAAETSAEARIDIQLAAIRKAILTGDKSELAAIAQRTSK